jgi:hypothetical protein
MLSIEYTHCVFSWPTAQSGLECIKERLWQETVQRYGVKKEFVKAEADTMREVLAELRKRYILCHTLTVYVFASLGPKSL